MPLWVPQVILGVGFSLLAAAAIVAALADLLAVVLSPGRALEVAATPSVLDPSGDVRPGP
jgi:hypothetical protein